MSKVVVEYNIASSHHHKVFTIQEEIWSLQLISLLFDVGSHSGWRVLDKIVDLLESIRDA